MPGLGDDLAAIFSASVRVLRACHCPRPGSPTFFYLSSSASLAGRPKLPLKHPPIIVSSSISISTATYPHLVVMAKKAAATAAAAASGPAAENESATTQVNIADFQRTRDSVSACPFSTASSVFCPSPDPRHATNAFTSTLSVMIPAPQLRLRSSTTSPPPEIYACTQHVCRHKCNHNT